MLYPDIHSNNHNNTLIIMFLPKVTSIVIDKVTFGVSFGDNLMYNYYHYVWLLVL